MMRRLFAAAALAAFCVLGLAAAEKPNFSGVWKLNNAKSDFGPMPAGPEKFERTIDHNDPSLKMTTVQAFQGQERTNEMEYTIDGKEKTIETPMGPVKVTPVWKGDNLEITVSREIQGNQIKSVETWSLSEDGKTLTVKTDISTPQGDFALKFVMDKQ
ncbi:MAG: hypothetical protein KatS3mg004_0334 [Bryobacteraceae bacterium]|nr:MAG: hypothetical protein KatS3mg004_0334 [Bryobacteraceae bacterium]